jgi:Flp pilus assembly pilin Flp
MKASEIVAAIASRFSHRNDDDEGQVITEYTLVIVLLAVVPVTIVTTVGKDVSGVFAKIDTALTSS